jgi:hypothetical protein
MSAAPNPNASPSPKDIDASSLLSSVWSFDRAVRGGFEVTAEEQASLAEYKFAFDTNDKTVRVNGADAVPYSVEGAYIDIEGTKLMYDGTSLNFEITDKVGTTRYYFKS